MASPDARTILRDVFLSDARDPDSTLTGLVTTPGVTTANFHQMIEIVLVIQGPYTIQHANETKTTLNRDSTPFLPGNYLLVTEGDVSVSDELFLTRANSNDSGARNKAFRKAVRRRDGRCVVTGLVNKYPSRGWLVWDAAHVFPVAYEGHWNARGLGRWVADGPSAGTVDSVWNGLLLSKSVHGLFDAYIFSINPDFLDDPDRPPDELLRWHFRQAVLANMRGTGEPFYEHDFPPGSDMVGEILEGPKPGERMEFELFSRLRESE